VRIEGTDLGCVLGALVAYSRRRIGMSGPSMVTDTA
jgi:hypothetical protein